MTEIIIELTMFKMTNKIINGRVLWWVKRVEAQRAHRAVIEATKESKEFDTLKKSNQQSNSMGSTDTETYCQTTANTMGLYTDQTDTQHMARVLQDMAALIALS